MTEYEDQQFDSVYQHLRAQNLPPADPFAGPSGRIGGAPLRRGVPSNSDHVPGFYSGLGRHWPKPGEVGYSRWNIFAGAITWIIIGGVALLIILWAIGW